jgi:glycosyltransferase involved in cell wall biosynthesis
MIDGYNLSFQQGTGVSTYARNLSYSLHELGHEVSILYGRKRIHRKNQLLAEVEFFDTEGSGLQMEGMAAFFHRLLNLARSVVAVFGYANAYETSIRGKVERSDIEAKLPYFDKVHNVQNLYLHCWIFFLLTGKFFRVKMKNPPDIFHWTYPLPIKMMGSKNVYTIHDLVPLKLPYTTLDSKRLYLRLCQKIAANADLVITVSEHSKKDILELLPIAPTKLANTYQPVRIPQKFFAKDRSELRSLLANLFGVHYAQYIVFVGAIEPKKNVRRMLEAYLGSDVEIPLIMVGPKAWMADQQLQPLVNYFDAGNYRGGPQILRKRQVRHLDYVSYPTLVDLVRGAKFLVFPSLYEGFGLPVLEAMSLGTPVLTSTGGSLPEIAGSAARLVDPTDTSAIRKAIQELSAATSLEDMARAGRERAKAFSIEQCTEMLAAAYAKLS